ncbi:sulfur oxidation c-type cytochrome SoxA [Methylobacterium longum]|uniref:SoxAX cytochrome complex subunit A n=1 Tax=Methylobacterium longum TaxID=767694 RepID=A0ABT8AV17_9HYPH|nr:sulfur oxidation c-type cytochrome SoxA [Methylobacterium longum]MDN3573803.1 sulfur oxidation c-type cytochrome SoxA [Methylobacterium longum]GJE13477.1 L-cysteine S-thiosulfotransferase subunit SoxA [Methylobacterium longum]
MPRRSTVKPLALVACLLCGPPAGAGDGAPVDRRSGFDQMSPELRAMQRDDTANPGMLAVADGAELWGRPPASGKPSCAGCHGTAEAGMRGVAARYPAWDERTHRPIDLQGRIDQCRRERQGGEPLPHESPDILALTAFVSLQSRGLPIAPPGDTRLEPARAAGRALFARRMGQLGLSCAICHDDHWGRRLGSATIPQGHPTGYPLYRLEWQALGSLQRRLRNCLTGMRAEPFPDGAPDYTALELYLATRAAPLPVETPAIRP